METVDELLDALPDLEGDGIADVWRCLRTEHPSVSVGEVVDAVIDLIGRGWVVASQYKDRDVWASVDGEALAALRTDYEASARSHEDHDTVGVYLSLTQEGRAEWVARNPDPDRVREAWSVHEEVSKGVVTIHGASESIAREALRRYTESKTIEVEVVAIEPQRWFIRGTGEEVDGVRLVARRA
jgi:hypothetical protein